MGGQEKRKFSRIPFDASVRVLGEKGDWQSQLLDVSLKGTLIERPADWLGEIGDKYALTIDLGEHEIEISMEAKLAHENDQVVGFSCEHIDLDSMTHLKRLVELNLGSEALLERELTALVDGWSADG